MIKILKIKEIVINPKYFPRLKIDWHVAFHYAQAMKTGANFPVIEVAYLEGKYYLVDGMHRLDAYKRNRQEFVNVIVNQKINDFKQLYIASIQRNIGHGKPFTLQEKTLCAVNLRKMNFQDYDIASIVQIPIENLTRIIAQRLTNTFTGQDVVLKSSVKHLAGETVENDFNTTQENITGETQVMLINDLIRILEKNLIDIDNPTVIKKLNELMKLLKELTKKQGSKNKK